MHASCFNGSKVIDTEKSEGYDTRADVWSLGVTGLELWEAEPPLAGVPPMKAFSLITHGPHPLSLYPTRPPPETEEAKDDPLQPCTDLMPPEMFDFLSNVAPQGTQRAVLWGVSVDDWFVIEVQEAQCTGETSRWQRVKMRCTDSHLSFGPTQFCDALELQIRGTAVGIATLFSTSLIRLHYHNNNN
ncbi:Serine/threonine-protein kinase cst-1 [Taenia solium]|eukprot:TsM_000877100 transcript=TsM_000877100 gene=TsM_000877100